MIIDNYFAAYDIRQVVGDKFWQGFDLTVNNLPFSFTGYELEGEIKDTLGNVVAAFTFVKSTTVIADDTIQAIVLPENMPVRTGFYSYEIRYSTTAEDVRTLVRGKIALV
jgi:hypothetical protein